MASVRLDINVFQPGAATSQDLDSLHQVEILVSEEYLPLLLSNYCYYLMLPWDVSSREGYDNLNSPGGP